MEERLCIHCRWHVKPNWVSLCSHPKAGFRHLVSGEMQDNTCDIVRSIDTHPDLETNELCGQSGKWFEPAPEPAPQEGAEE